MSLCGEKSRSGRVCQLTKDHGEPYHEAYDMSRTWAGVRGLPILWSSETSDEFVFEDPGAPPPSPWCTCMRFVPGKHGNPERDSSSWDVVSGTCGACGKTYRLPNNALPGLLIPPRK